MQGEKREETGPLEKRFRTALATPLQDGFIAAAPESRTLLALAARAARTPATILLNGPSGAGKEVLARFIHAQSGRAPFVAINCAALPESMIESLLFGHERGAFTGAQNAAPGLFRAAEGGTLFLDEVGELPLAQQAKLLRVVEQREVLPLGAQRPVAIDIRLVAATNQPLEKMVKEGKFRADLLWRLSVFPLHLPPLAARPLDILPLAAHLLRAGAERAGSPLPLPTEEALAALEHYSWPGNVRELANCLERATILANNGRITPADLRLPAPEAGSNAIAPLAHAVRLSEAEAIERALAASGGRRAGAATRLGISERTLRYKLAALRRHPGAPRPLPHNSSMEVSFQ